MSRFLFMLVLLILLASLDAGKAKKKGGGKKKKKDKEVVTAVKEPKMKNLWKEGGYVYRPDKKFSVRNDPIFQEAYFSQGAQEVDEDNYSTMDIVLFIQSVLNTGAVLKIHYGLSEYDMEHVYDPYYDSNLVPGLFLVGYVDTFNRTLQPPALKRATCNLDVCYELFDYTTNRLFLELGDLATPMPDNTLHRLQDQFLEGYQGLKESLGSSSSKKILCQGSYVDSLVRSIQEEVEVKSAETEEFMARPISFDAYQADAILPEIFDSVSARIMLKVVEGLCGL